MSEKLGRPLISFWKCEILLEIENDVDWFAALLKKYCWRIPAYNNNFNYQINF